MKNVSFSTMIARALFGTGIAGSVVVILYGIVMEPTLAIGGVLGLMTFGICCVPLYTGTSDVTNPALPNSPRDPLLVSRKKSEREIRCAS